MFADFNKVFNNNQKKEARIPDIILEELNKALDDGLKYKDIGDGLCSLFSDDDVNIRVLSVVIDDKMKKYIGDKINQQEILDYSYNTQRPLKLVPQEEGCLFFNGHKIQEERICFNPLKSVEKVKGEFYAIPAPFPAAKDIVIGDGEYEYKTQIIRKPCFEKEYMLWSTVDEKPIYIEAKININTRKMTCNLKLQLKDIKSVYDIVSTLSVYCALGTGKALINGEKIKFLEFNTDIKHDRVLLSFWNKVLLIEKILDCNFNIDNVAVDGEIIKQVELLYQMLINKKVIKSTNVLESFTSTFDMKENKRAEELKNVKCSFMFDSSHIFSLFGTEIKLPGITVVPDIVIADVKIMGNQQELIIDNSENKAYYLELLFVSEAEREEYCNKGSMDEFNDAKTINYYLNQV